VGAADRLVAFLVVAPAAAFPAAAPAAAEVAVRKAEAAAGVRLLRVVAGLGSVAEAQALSVFERKASARRHAQRNAGAW
jgi:hypothetical protein